MTQKTLSDFEPEVQGSQRKLYVTQNKQPFVCHHCFGDKNGPDDVEEVTYYDKKKFLIHMEVQHDYELVHGEGLVACINKEGIAHHDREIYCEDCDFKKGSEECKEFREQDHIKPLRFDEDIDLEDEVSSDA